jgi:putative glutamine amidotransferase
VDSLESKPRIGIVPDHSFPGLSEVANEGAEKLIENAGGIPVFLEYYDENNKPGRPDPSMDIKDIQGLVLIGNSKDIDPADYGGTINKQLSIWLSEDDPSSFVRASGPVRAEYENKMLRMALERKIPIFTTCAGTQRLNVFLGGSLYQHVPALIEDSNAHGHEPDKRKPKDTTVKVRVLDSNSGLAKILKNLSRKAEESGDFDPADPLSIKTNCMHHQSIYGIGNGLRIAAYAAHDLGNAETVRIVEAVEPVPGGNLGGQFILGVQWHPEIIPDSDISKAMAEAFVTAAKEYLIGRQAPGFSEKARKGKGPDAHELTA